MPTTRVNIVLGSSDLVPRNSSLLESNRNSLAEKIESYSTKSTITSLIQNKRRFTGTSGSLIMLDPVIQNRGRFIPDELAAFPKVDTGGSYFVLIEYSYSKQLVIILDVYYDGVYVENYSNSSIMPYSSDNFPPAPNYCTLEVDSTISDPGPSEIKIDIFGSWDFNYGTNGCIETVNYYTFTFPEDTIRQPDLENMQNFEVTRFTRTAGTDSIVVTAATTTWTYTPEEYLNFSCPRILFEFDYHVGNGENGIQYFGYWDEELFICWETSWGLFRYTMLPLGLNNINGIDANEAVIRGRRQEGLDPLEYVYGQSWDGSGWLVIEMPPGPPLSRIGFYHYVQPQRGIIETVGPGGPTGITFDSENYTGRYTNVRCYVYDDNIPFGNTTVYAQAFERPEISSWGLDTSENGFQLDSTDANFLGSKAVNVSDAGTTKIGTLTYRPSSYGAKFS